MDSELYDKCECRIDLVSGHIGAGRILRLIAAMMSWRTLGEGHWLRSSPQAYENLQWDSLHGCCERACTDAWPAGALSCGLT